MQQTLSEEANDLETRKSQVTAFIIAAILTIIIVGSMIIIDEVDTSFKSFLNSITGHHWVTKGVFTAVLFPVFSMVFYLLFRSERARKALHANAVFNWSLLLVGVTSVFFLGSFINYVLNYII